MSSPARLQSILRVPIKSFQGESIESTDLDDNGILADRLLALREKESGKILSGKHARVGDRILELEARFDGEPKSGQPLPAVIATIDGAECPTDDVAEFTRRCSEALDRDVELVTAGNGACTYDIYWPEVEGFDLSGSTLEFPLGRAEVGSFADLEPLHLLTTGSIAHLSSLMPGSEISLHRFRPSLLLDTGDASGFVEDEWLGRTATLGTAKLELTQATPRCVMTTRPQRGLPKDVGVLRTLVQNNQKEFMGMQMPCLGIYAKVTEPGRIAVGDELKLA